MHRAAGENRAGACAGSIVRSMPDRAQKCEFQPTELSAAGSLQTLIPPCGLRLMAEILVQGRTP